MGTVLTRDAESAAPAVTPRPIEGPAVRGRVLAYGWWLPMSIIFLWSFVYRFLTAGLVNDHFRKLAQARQVLLEGEAPFRDFVDPGIFLQIYVSAATQLLFGYSLLGEILLSIFLLSAGAALTFLLAARASGSGAIGFVLALLVVLTNPRLHQYHGVFLPALGLLCCWRYVDRRTTGRLVVVALATAAVFLFRHDQGAYLAVAALAVLIAVHWSDGPRMLLRRSALYSAVVAVSLTPFVAFLQMSGGVVEYVRSASEYVRSEVERQTVLAPQFVIDPSAPLLTTEPPPPPIAARVGVRWSERAPRRARRGLEQTYALTNPRADPDSAGRSWAYDLVDFSPANVAALVREPLVEDTDGIDRTAGQVIRPPRESFLMAWQRAVPLLRVRIAPGLVQPANAIPWLYHLFVALPVLALLVLAVKHVWRHPSAERLAFETPKILCVAVLCLVAQRGLLRDPFSYRLADAAAPIAILAAWLLGRWLADAHMAGVAARLGHFVGRRRSVSAVSPTRPVTAPLGRVLAALALLGVTGISAAEVGEVDARLAEMGLLFGPAAMIERGRIVFDTSRTSPPIEAWASSVSVGRRALARYVYECTEPTDRLLVTWFTPDLYFYSGRSFAGRQLFWFSGYYSSEAEQQASVDSLATHPVPIILMRQDPKFPVIFPHVYDYIVQNYHLVMESSTDGANDGTLQVYVDNRLAPSGTYAPLSLPCYRGR